MNDYKTNDQLRGICARGCGRQDKQLNTFDYMADVPGNNETTDLVEVQFKNTRKGYYHNDNHLPLEKEISLLSKPARDTTLASSPSPEASFPCKCGRPT